MDLAAHSPLPLADKMSAEFEQKLGFYRSCDQEREALIRNLINGFQKMELDYCNALSDLENERRSRRELQQQNARHEASLAQFQKTQDSSPYVAVIVDGDGAAFLDELYERGDAGGADAAGRLNDELEKFVAHLVPGRVTSHWSIVVTIFINMEGITNKLRACGLLKQGFVMQKFCQAFSRNQPLYQIVDVGPGKEQADYKLRAQFRLNLGNVQCKHIFLGGICHDNGYLPMLEQYKHDSSTTNRVALLETLPAQPLYKDLPFKIFQASTVFRAENLPAKPPFMDYNDPKNVQGQWKETQKTIPDPPAPALSRSQTPSPLDSAVGSWATVSRIDNGSMKDFDVSTKKPAKLKYILLNDQQARIDARLPNVDKGSQDRLYRRVKDFGKVCNYFHLTGKCKGECGFIHGTKLPDGELNALRHKARTRPCASKTDCHDFECIFGHICPYGTQCFGSKCAFVDTHDMNLIPALKWYENGRIEHLSD